MMSLPLKCMHMYKCLFVSVRENSAWTDRFPDREKESERERENINTRCASASGLLMTTLNAKAVLDPSMPHKRII